MVDPSSNRATRPRPPGLRALGPEDPPTQIELGGHVYHRIEIFKHDSIAATALYQGPQGQVVCKFNRQHPWWRFVPMGWLGRWLAEREAEALRKLADLPAVPDELGLSGSK